VATTFEVSVGDGLAGVADVVSAGVAGVVTAAGDEDGLGVFEL
jgi:hypothetical protein